MSVKRNNIVDNEIFNAANGHFMTKDLKREIYSNIMHSLNDRCNTTMIYDTGIGALIDIVFLYDDDLLSVFMDCEIIVSGPFGQKNTLFVRDEFSLTMDTVEMLMRVDDNIDEMFANIVSLELEEE